MSGSRKVAILGATSHIAKGLIVNFLSRGEDHLALFSRSALPVHQFLGQSGYAQHPLCQVNEGFSNFLSGHYDAVINCVGVGTGRRLGSDYSPYFTVTEAFDNLSLDYLIKTNRDATYISLSSGAIYGRGHDGPITEGSKVSLDPNALTPGDYYGIARLNAEAKHRAFTHLNIIDLRLFSYFSRFADLSDGYFMTDLISCLLEGTILPTDSVDIVRDYVHPDDLFAMVLKCLDTGTANDAFDVSSAKPVTKTEILHFFEQNYGLRYEVTRPRDLTNPTGAKTFYCADPLSMSRSGYRSRFTSLETLSQESAYFLGIDRHSCSQTTSWRYFQDAS